LKSKFCISVAKNPGKFGETVHNAGYKALGLDFQYKAFSANNIFGVIEGVKALGIRGCSISMPFKEKVVPLLDELDPLAKKAKAVNTIVNNNGYLIGYNTDVLGMKNCLKPLKIKKNKKILVLGAGGVARAILVALENLKFKNVVLSNRTAQRGRKTAKEFHIEFIQWSKRTDTGAAVIINATPIGMSPNSNSLPISQKSIIHAQLVIDVIVKPPNTKFIQVANINKIPSIDGTKIALNQAYEQFKLYTGKKAPKDVMQKASKEIFMG
jgi:shikimate dehydrogenase